MISETYEKNFENDENGRWVSKLEAALHLGKTERTIENRMKSGNLTYKHDEDGKVWVFLRDSKLSKRKMDVVGNPSESFEGAFSKTAKDFEAFSEVQEKLSKTFEMTIEKLESQLDALENELSQTKETLTESRIKVAHLEAETNNAGKLIEELRNRIQDKDILILALQREVELEKNRAEQFNNQLSSAHSKIQEYKSQEQFMRELTKRVEALQAAQNITIKTEPASPEEKSKSFSIFGFEIRRSK